MVLYLLYGAYYSTDFSKLKSKFQQKWASKFDKKLKIFKRIRKEKSAGLTKGFGRVTLLLYEQNANAMKKRVSCMRLLQRIPGGWEGWRQKSWRWFLSGTDERRSFCDKPWWVRPLQRQGMQVPAEAGFARIRWTEVVTRESSPSSLGHKEDGFFWSTGNIILHESVKAMPPIEQKPGFLCNLSFA